MMINNNTEISYIIVEHTMENNETYYEVVRETKERLVFCTTKDAAEKHVEERIREFYNG